MRKKKDRMGELMGVNIKLTAPFGFFSLTLNPYLSSRFLGDDQVCMDSVCQRIAYIPVGLPPRPGLCLPEPGVAYGACSTA